MASAAFACSAAFCCAFFRASAAVLVSCAALSTSGFAGGVGGVGCVTGITGASSTLGFAVCCICFATFSCAVSAESVCSKGIGSGGNKSSGVTKTILICLGGSTGLLMPKKSKPVIATTWTPRVNPSAIVFSLDCGFLKSFILYSRGLVSKLTCVKPAS